MVKNDDNANIFCRSWTILVFYQIQFPWIRLYRSVTYKTWFQLQTLDTSRRRVVVPVSSVDLSCIVQAVHIVMVSPRRLYQFIATLLLVLLMFVLKKPNEISALMFILLCSPIVTQSLDNNFFCWMSF